MFALTYGFCRAGAGHYIKLVAQAAFDRNKGGILPLAAREELSALASAPEDATEIDSAPPQPSSPQPRPEVLSGTHSHAFGRHPGISLCKGVAMRKEGRLRDAIDMLEAGGEESVLFAESPGADRTLPQVSGRPWGRDSGAPHCLERSVGISERGYRCHIFCTDPRISRAR